MLITSQIRERITIKSMKRNIELHKSLNNTIISKSDISKKIPIRAAQARRS
jgi:protein associated with RNAse G/E